MLTYELVHIPTPTLSSLCGISKALVRLKMPVQVPRFLCFAFFCAQEAPPTSKALVWSIFIQM